MTANPFEKTQFESHRDWEESLVEFLVAQAKNPDVRSWLFLTNSLPSRKAAAFSALLLSDLLETKPGFRDSVDKTYDVYNALREPDSDARKFEEWLRSGWLSVSRVAGMVDAELKMSVTKDRR